MKRRRKSFCNYGGRFVGGQARAHLMPGSPVCVTIQIIDFCTGDIYSLPIGRVNEASAKVAACCCFIFSSIYIFIRSVCNLCMRFFPLRALCNILWFYCVFAMDPFILVSLQWRNLFFVRNAFCILPAIIELHLAVAKRWSQSALLSCTLHLSIHPTVCLFYLFLFVMLLR